ncbi:hypothetical protein Tco_0510073 [Tanacetum coccineum]
MEHCARKDALIRSPTGIEAGLEEHLASMERPDRIPIEDRAGLGRGLLNGVGMEASRPAPNSPHCYSCVIHSIATPKLLRT